MGARCVSRGIWLIPSRASQGTWDQIRPLGTEEWSWDIQPDVGHDSKKFSRKKKKKFSIEGKRKSERMKTWSVPELKEILRNLVPALD